MSQLAAKLDTPLLVGETVRRTELPHYLQSTGACILRGDTLMKVGITGLRIAMALALSTRALRPIVDTSSRGGGDHD